MAVNMVRKYSEDSESEGDANLYNKPMKRKEKKVKREKKKDAGYSLTDDQHTLTDAPFVHLHVHSQFSVLQATSDVKSLVAKAQGCKRRVEAIDRAAGGKAR